MMSSAFARNRECRFPLPHAEVPMLNEAWKRSTRTYGDMAGLAVGKLHTGVSTVVLSGSIGRMEQIATSDCDLMVILDDDTLADASAADAAFQSVWDALHSMGLTRPESDGIFTRPSSQRELCDPSTLGHIDEDMDIFGKRFQLLLDCQPVSGEDAFGRLVRSVLERYAGGDVSRRTSGEWMFLLNDLIRYFRSLAIRYQWYYLRDPHEWRVLNVKFKHSRFMNYAGLLLLLGESSRHENKLDWVEQHLRLTSLERVAHVFQIYQDEGFEVMARCYNQFLSRMADSDFRKSLAASDDNHPSENAAFQELDSTAAKLRSEFTRFVLNRRGDWSDRFVELLLF